MYFRKKHKGTNILCSQLVPLNTFSIIRYYNTLYFFVKFFVTIRVYIIRLKNNMSIAKSRRIKTPSALAIMRLLICWIQQPKGIIDLINDEKRVNCKPRISHTKTCSAMRSQALRHSLSFCFTDLWQKGKKKTKHTMSCLNSFAGLLLCYFFMMNQPSRSVKHSFGFSFTYSAKYYWKSYLRNS